MLGEAVIEVIQHIALVNMGLCGYVRLVRYTYLPASCQKNVKEKRFGL
jgi:hypothetical protein